MYTTLYDIYLDYSWQFMVILYFENSSLGRAEGDKCCSTWLLEFSVNHRFQDLFVWCWVHIDDSLSSVGLAARCLCFGCASQQTLGTLCRFCRLPHAIQDQSVTRISGKLNCLTGCEETAPTGTRTSHRPRTACAAYQEKAVMLVNGMVWNGGAWIVISAKVIHGPSWSFWEHAILGERNETDVARLDGLTYIEFYHRPSDLFVWCWVMLSYIDDILSRVGTEPQVVLHNHKLYMCLIFFPANVGYTVQFFAVYQLPQKTKVLRISGKLNCLTGCEETAPTGTRQATDRGQHAQHIKKKLWC